MSAITVSDPVGLVTLGIGISWGVNAWELINKAGLIYIPFIAALVTCVIEARASQAEVGVPSVTSLRYIEKAYMVLFLTIIFFALPVGSKGITPSFGAYSCDSDGRGVLAKHTTLYELLPNSSSLANLPAPKLPIAIGLVHQLSASAAGAFTSQMGCEPDSDIRKAELRASGVINGYDDSIREAVKLFNQVCYIPAMKRLGEIVLNHRQTIPLDDEAMHLDLHLTGQTLQGLMSGSLYNQYKVLTSQVQDAKPLEFWTGDKWLYSAKNEKLECNKAAYHVDAAIRGGWSSDDLDALVSEAKSKQNFNGYIEKWPNLPMEESVYRVSVAQTYMSIIQDDRLVPEAYWKQSQHLLLNSYRAKQRDEQLLNGMGGMPVGWAAGHNSNGFEKSQAPKNTTTLGEKVGYAALLKEGFVQAINIERVVPYLIMLAPIALSAFYALLPLLLLVAGYKSGALILACSVIVVLNMTPYLIEMGVYIQNVFFGLYHGKYGIVESVGHYTPIMMVASGYLFTLMPLVVFVYLLALAGGRLSDLVNKVN